MRTRRSTITAATGFVVVAILGAIALGSGTLGSQGSTGPAFRGPHLPGECGGKRLTLSEAAARAPYPLLVPDKELASTENLNSAEWCDASKLLVLTFSSGVSVEMMPSEIGDPSSEFAAQEARYPGVVTAGSIRGEPAAFAEPGATDPTSVQRAPGGVEFVEGMLLIDVVGNGSIALDDLKAVTESLAPYAPR
ncbi:MAG: hypothetical protein M3P18_23290 [Actinomycetota bacterium]|nr:hypothetical protein [Actinomycetota bacterium]